MDNFNKYYELKKRTDEISYLSGVLYYDATTDSPAKAREYSYDLQAKLNSKAIELRRGLEFKNIINDLSLDSNLEPHQKRIVELEKLEIEKLDKIPSDKLIKHLNNQNRAYMAWEEGRSTLDYGGFEKELDELVSYYKEYISLLETDDKKGYDVLLNDFEKGFGVKEYDELFSLIEKELLPLIKRILATNDKMPNLGEFPLEKQRELTKYLTDILGYTSDRGTVRETIHPYTIPLTKNDARITTAYLLDNVFSNMYSVMHETGHALYALDLEPKYLHTALYSSASMSMDESQSRFIENYIGRDINFISFIKPKLEELFPVFKKYSNLELYKIINMVSASYYRTEADELTYPIHVLIRYKIEKGLYNGDLKVSDISKTFDDLMENYLGIRPHNKKEGCYQDVHWSSDFGYFPTYVLGSAIGAQLLNKMKQELDYDKLLLEGNLKPILAWLKDKIHKYGALYDTNELLIKATGEPFNPKYYIDYLINKFKDIYEV